MGLFHFQHHSKKQTFKLETIFCRLHNFQELFQMSFKNFSSYSKMCKKKLTFVMRDNFQWKKALNMSFMAWRLSFNVSQQN